jgi:hypothetical protein
MFNYFTTQAGIFNVRYVPVGSRYGNTNRLMNDCYPLVEFFDPRHAVAGLGMFVSRYDARDVLNMIDGRGLRLDLQFPEWSLSADEIQTVKEFIRQSAEQNG